MQFLSYLKHLGIHPVKARQPLPGAASSNDALNQYYREISSSPSQQQIVAAAVQPQNNLRQQEAPPYFDANLNGEYADHAQTQAQNMGQKKSAQDILQEMQGDSSQTASHASLQSGDQVESKIGNANKISAQDFPDKPEQAKLKKTELKQYNKAENLEQNTEEQTQQATETPQFTLWVYHHLGLNALVCAEVNSKVRSEVEGRVILLQNMLKALSGQQAIQTQHQWKRDRFKWPLDVGLDNDLTAAREVFQAYFKNYQQPKTLLLFSEQYLPNLLGLSESQTSMDSMQKMSMTHIWPNCPVLSAPSLQTYIDNPASKKPLWLAIKDLYT